jgi:hypothetical protein
LTKLRRSVATSLRVAKLVEQRFAAATKAMRDGASKEDVWRLLEGGDRDCKTHSYFGGQLFPFLEKHQHALAAVTGCIIKLDIDVRIVLAAFIAALHGGPVRQGPSLVQRVISAFRRAAPARGP